MPLRRPSLCAADAIATTEVRADKPSIHISSHCCGFDVAVEHSALSNVPWSAGEQYSSGQPPTQSCAKGR